jgi:hypothetical protein
VRDEKNKPFADRHGVKMSLLSEVTTGKQIGAQIHVIAGTNGVGKTTWAAGFPSCLVIDLEKGSEHLDVDRIPAGRIKNLADFRSVINELRDVKHSYKSVVIDSAEALEGLISDQVCADGHCDSIEQYEGGYGKGYVRSREIMREIMFDLRALQAKGITTIITAHTQVKTITDPAMNQTYDRVIMRCNDKMAALIRDLADNVFYATYKVFTTKENGKTRAFGDGQRVMYTSGRPGFDAKNRLDLPHEIDLSYEAFAEACAQAPEASPDTLLADILAMAEMVDEKLRTKVNEQIEKFKNNPAKLKEVKNRLMKYTAA